MTLARGVAGAGGNIVPPVPTALQITRNNLVAAGSTPAHDGSWTNSFGNITKNLGRSYTVEFFQASNNASVGTYTFTTPTFATGGAPVSFGITLVKGTSYYYKVRATDIRSGLTGGFSAASSSLTALTLPSIIASYSSASGSINTASATWTAPSDNGGESVSYDWELRNNVGGAVMHSGNTANLNISQTVTPGNYFFRVRAKNALGQGPVRDSVAFTVTAPPFFPFFPSFGPFFPSFGPFFPSFGPFFGGFY